MSDWSGVTPPPKNLGPMRATAIDTRGDDLTAYLSWLDKTSNKVVVDPVSAILSVTVRRVDGVALGATELVVTPTGKPPPWTTAAAGSGTPTAIPALSHIDQ